MRAKTVARLAAAAAAVVLAAPGEAASVLRAVALRHGPEDWEVRRVESFGAAGAVAWAEFEDGLNATGWGVLDVHTDGKSADGDQAYAAGLVEGFLTAEHISTTAHNLANAIFKQDRMPRDIKKFMDKQDNWARDQIDKRGAKEPFFAQLGYLMRQYDGLVDGYVMRTPEVPYLESSYFQMLNGVGDLFDIMPTVRKNERVNFGAMKPSDAERAHARRGHCSAIIKAPGDFSDLFIAHSSWYTFSNTDRIMKHYNLRFSDPSTAAQRVSFSSYPGFLESLDDFYMLSSGLVWTQTSNPQLNHSVYEAVKPESLLAWQRVRVASAMASTGPEWFKAFRTEFSGTYANQYMIVDLNRFEPGMPLEDDTLWVIEEMPGLVLGADQTAALRLGYWPSYNVPVFPEMWERAGYGAMMREHGPFWSYSLNPRGKIFRRDQGSVRDIASLKRLMRSNDFRRDPYSFDGTDQNPLYAICSRGDLAPGGNGEAMGCYDTKVTSHAYGAMQQRAEILNGPTASLSGGDLPPFRWAGPFASEPHKGLPPVYNFSFIKTAPKPLAAVAQDA